MGSQGNWNGVREGRGPRQGWRGLGWGCPAGQGEGEDVYSKSRGRLDGIPLSAVCRDGKGAGGGLWVRGQVEAGQD